MSRISIFLCLAALLVSCGSETIVHKTNEREANKIIEVLDDAKIHADKGVVDTGREVYFTISVPMGDKIKAIRTLNDNELPKREDTGYQAVFSEGGLIPTSSEERAKFLQALEGELQQQLKLIDGILDAQVQVVMPEDNALRTTEEKEPETTASVTIKYLPGAGGSKPLSEPQVQAIMAAGVEKLTPDRVVVVMTPGGTTRRSTSGGKALKGTTIWKLWPDKRLNVIAMGIIGVILFLCLGLIYAQVRLRTVRGRLIRLQTEIAKARRRPGGESSLG